METQTFRIDHLAEEKLGIYIYALIDPRDQKVFYIGQGRKSRIDGHFQEAMAAVSGNRAFTSKLRRIQNIWEENLRVEVMIVRRNLPSEAVADHVEGSCIAALGFSQNGATYNLNAGPKSVGHGAMSIEEVEMLNAQPVSPGAPISQVFVFNSNANTQDPVALYSAVRGDWTVSRNNAEKVPAVAAVLSKGVSIQAYKIEAWEPSGDKHRFRGKVANQLAESLVHKNWSTILGTTPGFWARGQYLIVNFDGNGKFQFVRGLPSEEWFEL